MDELIHTVPSALIVRIGTESCGYRANDFTMVKKGRGFHHRLSEYSAITCMIRSLDLSKVYTLTSWR